MAGTFVLTLLAWVFFRAPTLTDAVLYLERMGTWSALTPPQAFRGALPFVSALVVWEWVHRQDDHGLKLVNVPRWTRRLVYLALVTSIMWYGGTEQEFIYFQF